LGILYGLAHHLLQGKGWQYHLYLFVGFLCAACAAASYREEDEGAAALGATRVENTNLTNYRRISRISSKKREIGGIPGNSWNSCYRRLPPWATCVALTAAALVAGRAILLNNDHGLPEKNRLMATLVQDIASRVQPGDTVQVLDITYGGLDALLRLKLRQPTRFIYDFPFFMDPGRPYVQTLRRQFIEQLRAGTPRLIVIFERGGGWPGKDYNRLAAFGELQQFLDQQYLPPSDGPEYRVYTRKERAQP